MSRTGVDLNNNARLKSLNNPVTRAVVLAVALTCFIPGCSTPFYWTDNPVLLYLPGAGRRSDPIPGYVKPSERIKLIQEKGRKGAKAPSDEKDMLLVQLVQEYEKTTSPHIKRASLEAIGRISVNYANPAAEKIFQEALEDDDMALNLSAARALSVYATEGAIGHENKEQRKLAISLLTARYRALPFSIAAGSEEENSRRKDVRIAILHALAEFKEDDSPELLEFFDDALTGEKLDDGALEATACASLGKITGEKYGLDGEKWASYLAYKRGEESEKPSQTSILARTPRIDNVTGIVK
ncbi:MAG: HEAT repeat domain-containing protein [Thermoguttaceae bacterium]|nr:HEAT repeat domain-containing protein [Thermoguttaceae bacterium]